MKLEYSVWNMPGGWKPLKATNISEATQELMRMGPHFEEARIRDADTQKVYGQTNPYGKNGGQRCDVLSGPCACGAWH